MNLTLIAVFLTATLMLYLLFTPRIGWNWSRYAHMSRAQARQAAPFWLGLITLLSIASIFFSIRALIAIHGIAK